MQVFHFPNTEFGLLNLRRSGRLRRCVNASPDEVYQAALARLMLALGQPTAK